MHHCMNEMNGETQESNDCKRQLRLQKRREQAEQDLPVMGQNPTRACERVVRRARETSQKTHKRLKGELQRHASRRQCKKAEQRLARRREQEPPNRELKRFI